MKCDDRLRILQILENNSRLHDAIPRERKLRKGNDASYRTISTNRESTKQRTRTDEYAGYMRTRTEQSRRLVDEGVTMVREKSGERGANFRN